MNPALTRQLVYVAGGLMAAAAGGFLLPDIVRAFGAPGAIAVAIATGALVGLLLLVRVERDDVRSLAEEIAGLRGALKLIERALSEGHGEAEALRDALANGDMNGDSRVSRVVAEVRVLQGLIERLANPALPAATPATPEAEVLPPRATAAPALDVNDPMVRSLREALRLDRVDIYLQPIVGLPHRKPHSYECFSRVRDADGVLLLPEKYLPLAEAVGLASAVDNILLFRSVQLVRRARRKTIETSFFCNISPHSVADVEFFSAFGDFLEENSDLSGGLVFEFRQEDAQQLFSERRMELARLARLGYRYSIDGVTDLNLDADTLAARNIRFVKIDAKHMLARGRTPGENRALKERLDAAGVALVVTKIDREKDLLDLLDAGIDFGQGFLFGEPRPARTN